MKYINENTINHNPFRQFALWYDEARKSGMLLPEAMTLATVSVDGTPSARVVLMRGFDETGFVFFTNYKSQKGNELAANPNAALNFYWSSLARQVHVAGIVEKVTPLESDEYFSSRPRGSQIGAWASPQSMAIKDRKVLDKMVVALKKQFSGKKIPRPPHWGGYRVIPDAIEFWQGRNDRLHDRFIFTILKNGRWKIQRLAP